MRMSIGNNSEEMNLEGDMGRITAGRLSGEILSRRRSFPRS